MRQISLAARLVEPARSSPHERRRPTWMRRGAVNLSCSSRTVMAGVLLVALWTGACGSQDETSVPPFNPDPLRVPYATRATIDGRLSAGEWVGANEVRFSFENVVGDSVRVDVSLMHDGGSLQVAYGFEAPHEAVWYAPELFIDTGNDRSTSLRADDWWFHVSGSDCAAAGRYDDYSTCTLSADWETGPTPADRGDGTGLHTVEIRIPFSKLGVTQGDDISLAFRVEHSAQVSGAWVHRTVLWPFGASPDSPATWKAAQLVASDSR